MLEKTAEKLERRFESLPIHHIDTSVIMELEKTIDGKFCKRYIHKLNYSYRGIISSPTLSELAMSMLLLKDENKRFAFLDVLVNLVNIRKVGFYVPEYIHEISKRIKSIDQRLEPTDIDIVACAIENNALNLVTLDRNLIGNRAIEREFGLRICHPKDLL